MAQDENWGNFALSTKKMVAILAAVVAGAFLGAVPAQASTATGHVVATAPMTVLCKADPAKVGMLRPGENPQDACARTADGQLVRPANSVPGTCGDSFIFLDDAGRGNVHADVGVESTKGAILGGAASINWINFSANRRGSHLHGVDNNNPPGWVYSVELHTGSGIVGGDLGGFVLTLTLDLCTIEHPTDHTIVT